jgi:O-antigen/teichoic acid export membrane protein
MTDAARASGGRLVRDVLAQVVAHGGNLVLGVVVTVVLARELGVGDFGRWFTILAVLGIGGYLADLGLEQVAVRQASADPDREPSWVGALVVVQVALAIPTAAACALVLLVVADTDAMRTASLIACASVAVTSPTGIRVLFQLRVRNAGYSALQTARGAVWGLTAIAIVAVLDGGLVPLAWSFLAVSAAAAVAEVVLSLRLGRVRFGDVRRMSRELVRIGVPLGVASLLALTYARVDQVLVLELGGDRAAGLYGSVGRILAQLSFVPIALATTLFPAIVALVAEGSPRARLLARGGFEATLLATLPAFAVALAGGGPIMALLFGEEFRAAGGSLAILMAAFVPLAFNTLATTMLFVLDRQRLILRSAAIAAVVNVGLGFALIPDHGYVAAAWITLLTELLMLALVLPAVVRGLELRVRARYVALVVVAAAATGLAVAATRWAGAPDAAVLAVAGVYPLLLLVTRAVGREHLELLAPSR